MSALWPGPCHQLPARARGSPAGEGCAVRGRAPRSSGSRPSDGSPDPAAAGASWRPACRCCARSRATRTARGDARTHRATRTRSRDRLRPRRDGCCCSPRHGPAVRGWASQARVGTASPCRKAFQASSPANRPALAVGRPGCRPSWPGCGCTVRTVSPTGQFGGSAGARQTGVRQAAGRGASAPPATSRRWWVQAVVVSAAPALRGGPCFRGRGFRCRCAWWRVLEIWAKSPHGGLSSAIRAADRHDGLRLAGPPHGGDLRAAAVRDSP